MTLAADFPTPPRGEDLPYDDGEPMESDRHREQAELLAGSLRVELAARGDCYVAANMALYFSETQARHNDVRAPDLFVVVGTDPRERRSWVAWEEGGQLPDVIVEIVSPSTASVDRGTKKRLYGDVLRVPFYAIFDPFTSELEVYVRTAARQEALAPDGAGRFACAPLGFTLGVQHGTFRGITCGWLRFFRADGTPVLHGDERADQAEARADQAESRARAAEERVAALAARMRAAGLDPDGG